MLHLVLTISLSLAGVQSYETKDLLEVAEHAREVADSCGGPEHVLMIFDIDDTVLSAPSLLGSMSQERSDKIEPGLEDYELELRLHGAQSMTQYDTNLILSDLQRDGFPVMGMTARWSMNAVNLERELGRYGIGFPTAPSLSPEMIRYWDITVSDRYPNTIPTTPMPKGYDTFFETPSYTTYYRGLMLGTHRMKAPIITGLIRVPHEGDRFACVFFVDDSESNFKGAKNILKRFKDEEARVFNYFYSAPYKRVAHIDAMSAEGVRRLHVRGRALAQLVRMRTGHPERVWHYDPRAVVGQHGYVRPNEQLPPLMSEKELKTIRAKRASEGPARSKPQGE